MSAKLIFIDFVLFELTDSPHSIAALDEQGQRVQSRGIALSLPPQSNEATGIKNVGVWTLTYLDCRLFPEVQVADFAVAAMKPAIPCFRQRGH